MSKNDNIHNPSGLYVIMRTLRRVFKKDRDFIRTVSVYNDGSDYLEIKHNGNADYGKIVYVIKENCDHDGFCSTIRFVLCYLIYAKQHGMAPKIVMSKDFVYYDEDKSKEISNPWEYYFVQSDSIDENSALNVCYGNYYQMQMIRERYDINAYNIDSYYNDEIFKLCSPIVKEHLVLKPEIITESLEKLRSVREKSGKILGVHYRGTDYKCGYNGHPICIDESDVISEIKKVLGTDGFTAIFVATDDVSFVDTIKDSFKDTEVLMFNDVYRGNGELSVAFSNDNRKYHHYLLGYEIARDMYTLSLCDGLVAGKSLVGFISNIYKHSRDEEYEYMKIIDKGNYESNKPFVARPQG